MDVSAEIALINRLEEIRKAFTENKEKLISSYPSWNPNKDIRISVFSKCENVFFSTRLGMEFIFRDLTWNEWWYSTFAQKIPDQHIKNYIREFDIFLKLSFFHLFFSAIESSFRLFAYSLDPLACKSGRDNFKNIYSWLLNKLMLKKWESLLDLLCCIRNTNHNNGVYLPLNGKDKNIKFDGELYKFITDNKILFTWHQLLDFVVGVNEMLHDVILNPEIINLPAIDDPQATAK